VTFRPGDPGDDVAPAIEIGRRCFEPEVAQDLPAGARRLVQRSRGFAATVVNGETVLRDGKHTGALPGRLLRVVVVRRPAPTRRRQPGQRKPPPPVEAFFTTDLTLSLEVILAQYRERWAVEITLRDSNAFSGFGQDQCRKYTRVVGANTFRLVLAAARTLWFVEQASRGTGIALTQYRPWYRHKEAPSQLDIVSAWREALQAAGVFPIPRFTPTLATIPQEPEKTLPLAA